MSEYDVVVVGSGPNGLTAAILLARHGFKVVVLEAANEAGGSVRSGQFELGGFVHDSGAAVLPMAASSPVFSTFPLSEFGLKWVNPPAALAHPFDDGSALLVNRSVAETAEHMGPDSRSYEHLFTPLVDRWSDLLQDSLGTLRFPIHPLTAARFGFVALQSAEQLVKRFKGARARGLFAGLAAHSIVPLDRPPSAAIGLLMCASAHAVGWPMPSGGAGSLTRALVAYFSSLGGTVITGHSIKNLSDLPDAGTIFYDTAPAKIAELYGDKLPSGYENALRTYRYGAGIFKLDWALSGPIPWKAPQCREAGTVHIGGDFSEIAEAELAAHRGMVPAKPFVILAQPSLFDPLRSPAGKHTAWAYCHVPNGCNVDLTSAVEDQVERFAPGFRDRIIYTHISTPASLELDNPNLVGGDIAGGANSVGQLLCRPVCRYVPYAVPLKDVFLCSASTPPGAGVHGMCGFHAAQAFLRSKRVEYKG